MQTFLCCIAVLCVCVHVCVAESYSYTCLCAQQNIQCLCTKYTMFIVLIQVLTC